MASFESVLSAVGNTLKKFFTGAVVVAQTAEPLVAVCFPGVSELFNKTVHAVAQAETLAIASGAQSGTGPQKLAYVVSAIEAEFTSFAADNGIQNDVATITKWANAIVASLNSLPKLP